MDKFWKKCCIFTSCRKEVPLLENDHGPQITEGNVDLYAKEEEIKKLKITNTSLQKMVDQAEQMLKSQNIQISQLQKELRNVPEKTITEKITECKRVPSCKHQNCYSNPMVSTIKSVRAELKISKKSYDNLLSDFNSGMKKKTERIKQLTYSINMYKKDLENKENSIVELSNDVQRNQNIINNLQASNAWYEQNKRTLESDLEFQKNDITYLANSQQYYKNEVEKLKRKLASTRLDPILEEACPV